MRLRRDSTSSSRAPSPISPTSPRPRARHLAPEGRLYAMKGEHPADEIARLPASYRVVAAPALKVPGLDAARHLVLIAPASRRTD